MVGSASHAGLFLLCGPLLSNRTLFGRALSLSAENIGVRNCGSLFGRAL